MRAFLQFGNNWRNDFFLKEKTDGSNANRLLFFLKEKKQKKINCG